MRSFRVSRKIQWVLTVLVTLLVSLPAQADSDIRYFMFIGEPNAAAWKFLMENPADRKVEVEESFKALGGEVLSYYFGLGNGKNYITVTIPNDNELIQAIYLMRLPSGLLKSYEVLELMPSEQMSEALKRSKKLIENDTTVEK
jgi:uncharacterized protein with GYD domain